MILIKNWVPALAQAVGTADEQTFFVGHSMGCQTIARYLATLPESVQVGGVVFIAGFFKSLTNLEDDEEVREIANEWLTTPLNLADVFSHLRKSVAIFSDNDPFVPLENQDAYRDQLHSKIVVEHHMGHFSGSRDKVFELPVALEAIVSLAQKK
ncbi:alpha/beta hydrolase [Candidatus Uhrbacteria bacterium]|nr:alpha/beta hydrolase [Candidatus Uhrbacteria bacterium]